MKRIVAPALAGLLFVGLAGCSVIGSVQQRIGGAIARYCAEPQAEREALREAINARTQPNRIEVTCAVDAPPG